MRPFERVRVPVSEAASAGVLPLCLSRKPLVQPGAEGHSIGPGHVKHRMVQSDKTGQGLITDGED